MSDIRTTNIIDLDPNVIYCKCREPLTREKPYCGTCGCLARFPVINKSNCVLQDWLVRIPIRMQSTLLLGLRGPDTDFLPGIKGIQRWLRGLVFKPGNPKNMKQFMGELPPRIVEKDSVYKELEYCPMHFYSHLMHSLQVVGYMYPNKEVAMHAYLLFQDMCCLLHLEPETYSAFEKRLHTITWPGGIQPNDYEEAVQIMETHA